MRLSIRQNSDYIIEFDQFKINGREAVGGYGFTLTLSGSRKGFENSLAIFDIRLSVALPGPAQFLIHSSPSSNQIVQCSPYPNREYLQFEFILAKEQVNALEEHRQEKELKLNVGLRALMSSGGVLDRSYEHDDVIIPREQWLHALHDAAFRQTILFEVPLPTGTKELNELYGKAQEFIETGYYKDAVMRCRHIIEHIELLRNDKQQSISANKKAQSRQERQEMTANERMLNLREQIKNICHLGAHGSEHFTRSQAKAILGITMALLSEPTVGFSTNK